MVWTQQFVYFPSTLVWRAKRRLSPVWELVSYSLASFILAWRPPPGEALQLLGCVGTASQKLRGLDAVSVLEMTQMTTMRRRLVQARMWYMMSEREPYIAIPTSTLSFSWARSTSWWLPPTGSTTITTRSRSCWTGAGRCSGSKWPRAGFVSSSICGPSWPPWSAQNALRPKDTHLILGTCDSWDVGVRMSHGTTALPWNTTLHYPQCSNGGLSVAFFFIF